MATTVDMKAVYVKVGFGGIANIQRDMTDKKFYTLKPKGIIKVLSGDSLQPQYLTFNKITTDPNDTIKANTNAAWIKILEEEKKRWDDATRGTYICHNNMSHKLQINYFAHLITNDPIMKLDSNASHPGICTMLELTYTTDKSDSIVEMVDEFGNLHNFKIDYKIPYTVGSFGSDQDYKIDITKDGKSIIKKMYTRVANQQLISHRDDTGKFKSINYKSDVSDFVIDPNDSKKASFYKDKCEIAIAGTGTPLLAHSSSKYSVPVSGTVCKNLLYIAMFKDPNKSDVLKYSINEQSYGGIEPSFGHYTYATMNIVGDSGAFYYKGKSYRDPNSMDTSFSGTTNRARGRPNYLENNNFNYCITTIADDSKFLMLSNPITMFRNLPIKSIVPEGIYADFLLQILKTFHDYKTIRGHNLILVTYNKSTTAVIKADSTFSRIVYKTFPGLKGIKIKGKTLQPGAWDMAAHKAVIDDDTTSVIQPTTTVEVDIHSSSGWNRLDSGSTVSLNNYYFIITK